MKRKVVLRESTISRIVSESLKKLINEENVNASDDEWLMNSSEIVIYNEESLYYVARALERSIEKKIKRGEEIIPQRLAECRPVKDIVSKAFVLNDVDKNAHMEGFKKSCMHVANIIIENAKFEVENSKEVENESRQRVGICEKKNYSMDSQDVPQLVYNFIRNRYVLEELEKNQPEDLYEYIWQEVDNGMIYYKDQWDLLEAYFNPTELTNDSLSQAYENFVNDIISVIKVEEEGTENTENQQ